MLLSRQAATLGVPLSLNPIRLAFFYKRLVAKNNKTVTKALKRRPKNLERTNNKRKKI